MSLDSKMECLHLTMTEVLKRQNSKSKKGYNQVSRKEVWEKTEMRFKQPETNLAQTPTDTFMWFLQQCVAVDKQQFFYREQTFWFVFTCFCSS